MMNVNTQPNRVILIIVLTYLSFNGCGGAIGNINRYQYDIKISELKIHIDSVMRNNPSYSSNKLEETYKINSSEGMPEVIYILVSNNNQEIVFGFRPVEIGKKSMIVLIYAAQYGQALNLPKDMSLFEKTKYSNIFEKYFLKKLNEGIK